MRLKLSIVEAKSRGIGSSVSDGMPVKFGEPYRDFYTALDAEIDRRKANMAQLIPAPVMSTTVIPTPMMPPQAEPAPAPAPTPM